MRTLDNRLAQLLKTSPVITPSDAIQFGINRKSLSRLAKQHKLIRLGHGLYVDPNHEPGAFHTFLEVQKAVPKGVVCLLSALSVHGIGTQNPSLVWLAIPRGSRQTSKKYLPMNIVRYSIETYEKGIETITRDRVKIRTYSIPKTVADCFKFRNQVGLDVAIEALKDVIANRRTTPDEILKAAKVCRVESIITPYLESLL